MQKIILQKQFRKLTLSEGKCVYRFEDEEHLALFLFKRPEYVKHKIMLLTVLAKCSVSNKIKFDITNLFRLNTLGDKEEVLKCIEDTLVLSNATTAENKDDIVEIRNVRSLLILIEWIIEQNLISENTSTLFSWSVYDIFTDIVSNEIITAVCELDDYII